MSDVVTLTLRVPLTAALSLDGLTPDRCADLSQLEIASLPLWLGGRQVSLGDIFAVAGERAARVRIEGDLSRGSHVGARMRAGELTVNGSVGDDAGVAMSGGVLRVTGDAGDRLGSAAPGAAKGITGGEIILTGSAGAEVAARARRGLVVVAGEVGPEAGRAMIAGTVIVLGRTGAEPGRWNKRGSIVAAGGITIPDTYRYACTFQPPHLPLTMTYLRRQYGLDIDPRVVTGRYRRYCGDAGDPGKGEILALDASGSGR